MMRVKKINEWKIKSERPLAAFGQILYLNGNFKRIQNKYTLSDRILVSIDKILLPSLCSLNILFIDFIFII